MPLSEFYTSVDEKNESSQQKPTDISYVPSDEFVELIWEKGQILMQGQSSKAKKTPVASNFQFQTSRTQEKDAILDVIGSNQDYDMVPWLNYPLDDYSDLLPELSGVTAHEPAMHNNPNVIEKKVDKDPNSVSGIVNNIRSKPVLNFSHFSRPVAKVMAKVNAQKEVGQRSSDLVKVGSNPNPNPVDEPTHCVDFNKSTNDVNGGKETVKCNEPIGAASSVCSGNSVDRASNDLTKNCKRRSSYMEDFECQSQDDEEESLGTKTARTSRSGSGSKRSRAAEVHNLSERRRRDRINEKMRALQELIPNCNKVDKSSMLDEAIEYLKTLQLQVQIMSMGAGLCMPPMMFHTGMQHMHPPHFSPMGNIGMGMNYGMGMEMSGGPHMFPFSSTQGSRHTPSVYGHPSQGMPVLLPQPPMPGIPYYPNVRQVKVPDVGPTIKDPMTHASNQSQDANNCLYQSASADTKDQL